jgi:hypothetical protein
MDEDCQDRIAECLAHAVVGFSRVLERAIGEAEVEPPAVETTLQGFVVVASAPLRWASQHLGHLSDRLAVEAMYDEALRTGKVIKNLPDDDREIRRLHAEEVLRLPLHQLDHQPAGLTGTLYGSGTVERFYPNRLIASEVAPRDKEVSLAWREAQARVKQRRGAGFQPAIKRPAA